MSGEKRKEIAIEHRVAAHMVENLAKAAKEDPGIHVLQGTGSFGRTREDFSNSEASDQGENQ